MAGLKQFADYARNKVGSGINGAAYSIVRLVDNVVLASGSTAADTDPATTLDGYFSADETTLGYSGPLKATVTDASTGAVRVHTSKSLGIVGSWRAIDIPRAWSLFGDGVFPGVGSELAVSANGSSMDLTVGSGNYLIDMGRYALLYSWPSNQNLTVTTADASQARIDRVVLRVYPPGVEQEGRIDLVLLAGTPSSSPAAPGLTQSLSTYWEVSLATVQVDAGVTSIAVGKVTDTRAFSPAMPSGMVGGDILYVATSGKLSRLAKGTDGQYVKQAGGIPSWDSLTASDVSDFDTQVRTNRLDQMAAPTASVSLNSQKITSLATPTDATDAATKAYADALTNGLDIKQSVRVASTANVTVSNPGTAVFDGVTLTSGDRILLKNQSTASENGIYVFTNSASALTRSADADANAEVTSGLYVWVEEGTANADQGYVLTTNNPITLGTTGLTFTQFSGAGQITAGTGLTKTGNTLALDVPVSVARGGTGSTTAADARAALGVALGTDVQGWGAILDDIITAGQDFILDRILIGIDSQNNANTGTNSSDVTYDTAIDVDLTLPDGTWTAYVVGGALFRQSTSGQITVRATADGNAGNASSPSADATQRTQVVVAMTYAGLTSGTKAFSIQYKNAGGVSGTASAGQVWIIALAVRTG